MTSKPIMIGAIAAAFTCGMSGYVWHEEHRQPLLEVYVFGLKSGLSIFIRTPDDKRVLIDGGANSEIIRELTQVLPFYSRRIDTVIATNADGKYVSGLIDVLDRYVVDKAVIPAITLQKIGLASSSDQIYQTFLEEAERLNIPVQEVLAGDRLIFDQEIGDKSVRADILFPTASPSFDYSKASTPEIVLKISYGNTSIVLLGNATTKVQKYLLSSVDTHADVLIIPHGVSASSLSNQLMDDMRPEYVVYSHALTTSSKKSTSKDKKTDPLYLIMDDKRFNTKEKGTVKIVSDGSSLTIH